jgi:homospermidine synthase
MIKIYTEYDTMEKRSNKLKELIKIMKQKPIYNHKIYFIGYGCVGKPLLITLLKVCNIAPSSIYLIDERTINTDAKTNQILDKSVYVPNGVNVLDNLKVTKQNYLEIFSDLKPNDIIIDVCYSIDTMDIIKLCQEKGASYINSCIDVWNYKEITSPIEYSLKYRHDLLDIYNKSLTKKNFNGIISMGCNPGCVSVWAKSGIIEIWKKKKPNTEYLNKSFAQMSWELGIQTIHISERDTQQSSLHKKPDEYCNTWSKFAESYYEELLGCVEASWGTHEDLNYNNMDVVKTKSNNYLIWKKTGAYVQAQSWVPSYGRYIGNIIRHDEAYTIGRYLTLKNKYCPSVYYVYHPTDYTLMSVYELKEKNHKYQNNVRILTDDIINGQDILGLTFYLNDGTTYFIGSMLDIYESRSIFNNKYNELVNATNTQVCAGYLSGIIALMNINSQDKKLGLMCPDDLPHQAMLNVQLPFIGDFVFVEGTTDLIKTNNNFDNPRTKLSNWTFDNFIVQ